MQKRLLRLAIVAAGFPLATACQTPSLPFYSEVKEATKPVEDLSLKLKVEWCRGQIPQSIRPEEYDAWPEGAKDYATANVSQWLAAGCKL